MSKRFSATEIWDEDWFLELTNKEMLLWFFIKDNCDHAGVWKSNFKKFQMFAKCKVDDKLFFEKVNLDKQRITLLKNGRWFINSFIQFQYFDKKADFYLNLKNPLHRSIYKIINENEIDLKIIIGLKGVSEGGFEGTIKHPKDKVKDKDKEVLKGGVGENLDYFLSEANQNIPEDKIPAWKEWVEHCAGEGYPLVRTTAIAQLRKLHEVLLDMDVGEVIKQTIESRHKGFNWIIDKIEKQKDFNNGKVSNNPAKGSVQSRVNYQFDPEKFKQREKELTERFPGD